MLKISSGVRTGSRTANRDTCNPDPGEFAKSADRSPLDDRNVDRLLQVISESVIVDHDPSISATRELRLVSNLQPTPLPTRDELAHAEIDALLRRSGTATQHVHCDVEESAVILSGRVRRYHHLQIVLQIAMRCRAGREIVNKIGVDSNANS